MQSHFRIIFSFAFAYTHIIIFTNTAFAQVKWANKWGGSTTDMANALAIDHFGNQIVIGSFSGKCKMGNEELSSEGGGDVFIASFSQSGKLNWYLNFGSKGDDFGSSVAVNPAGDIVVAGIYSGDIHIDDYVLNAKGSNDVFLCWINAAGKVTRLLSTELGAGVYPTAVHINNKKQIALAGWYSTISINNEIKNAFGEIDFFIMQYNEVGKLSNFLTGGGLGLDECTSIFIDDDGYTYACGTFVKEAVLGNEELHGRAGSNAFFIKLNQSGSIQWYKTLNSLGGNVIPQHLTINHSGDVYAVGEFSDTIWDKGFVAFSHGQNDVFCVKINAGGNYAWLTTGGSPAPDKSLSVLALEKEVKWLGMCNGNARFGKKYLRGLHERGNFILSLDPKNGKIQEKHSWARTDLAVDNMGRFTPNGMGFSVCGYFTVKFDTGTRTLHSAGDEDVFLLQYQY